MNFGRAVLKGLAIGAKGWESEREEGKRLVQQLALVRLQQRANMMAEQRQQQFQVQLEILKGRQQMQQIQGEAQAKAEAEGAKWNSPGGRAGLDVGGGGARPGEGEAREG